MTVTSVTAKGKIVTITWLINEPEHFFIKQSLVRTLNYKGYMGVFSMYILSSWGRLGGGWNHLWLENIVFSYETGHWSARWHSLDWSSVLEKGFSIQNSVFLSLMIISYIENCRKFLTLEDPISRQTDWWQFYHGVRQGSARWLCDGLKNLNLLIGMNNKIRVYMQNFHNIVDNSDLFLQMMVITLICSNVFVRGAHCVHGRSLWRTRHLADPLSNLMS